MSWTRILVINCMVLIGLLIILEASYKAYSELKPKVTCENNWVMYGYCAGISTEKTNHVEDGGEKILIKVDEIGGRIDSSKSKFKSKPLPQLVLIGDSFIQADELRYSETIYGELNKRNDGFVYALGYSSWNPNQYFDAIKKIGVSNTQYVVFIMGNDINPFYDRSIYGEQKLSIEASKSASFSLRKILEATFMYKVFYKIKILLNSNQEENTLAQTDRADVLMSFQEFDVESWEDCKPLEAISNTPYAHSLGYDYLVYSKSYECWGDLHQEAYALFLQKVRGLNEYVEKELDSDIAYAWVSAGWAFENQNSKGRLFKEYRFPNDVEISQKGIIEKFRADLPEAHLIDTETILREKLSKCVADCENKFYLKMDGHWTSSTHSLLADYFSATFDE